MLWSGKNVRWLRYTVAAIFIFLAVGACALSQSRGPLFAVIVASVVGCFAHRRFIYSRIALCASLWSAVLAVILPYVLGAGSRMSAAALNADGSIQNRWIIWKDSLHSLFQCPASGLGVDEAGYFFSQWYQPQHLNYLYAGVFNEYLQLGVERGLLVLAVVLFVTFSIFFLPFAAPLREKGGHSSFADALALSAYLSLLVLGGRVCSP